MNEAITKAAALVEALGYIQRFHNKVIVVKVGGSIMDDEAALSTILNDIVFMNYVGMQPVLVHGGGKAINEAMKTAGLEPQMVMGRRYTDERTLAIAEHVLCNQINRFIVNFIQSQGCEAMGLHSLSSVVLFAEKTFLSGPEGRRIDLGMVGDVKSVNARLLQLLVQADSIPVIATIALAELYGQTSDANVRTKLERAVRLIINTQNPQGGWRYFPRVKCDKLAGMRDGMRLCRAGRARAQVRLDHRRLVRGQPAGLRT